jgi:hypothetical protein
MIYDPLSFYFWADRPCSFFSLYNIYFFVVHHCPNGPDFSISAIFLLLMLPLFFLYISWALSLFGLLSFGMSSTPPIVWFCIMAVFTQSLTQIFFKIDKTKQGKNIIIFRPDLHHKKAYHKGLLILMIYTAFFFFHFGSYFRIRM